MKKGYLYWLVIGVLVGSVIYLFLNREIVIKNPVVKGSVTKIENKREVFELPRQSVYISNEYFDSDSSYHQQYRHKLTFGGDSLGGKMNLLTDINIKNKTEEIYADSVEIFYPEKIVTNTVVDSIVVEKIMELPFYANNWFWYSIMVTALFFTSLFAIIFG